MNTVVQTTKGKIEGIKENNCVVFKNVPYAKPPVGELRWKRPVEADPWEGILNCTRFGNITVQDLPTGNEPWGAMYYKEFYADPDYLREMSEDCLNLNIWTPAEAEEGDHLPVAFWIHGGGFGGGYSSEIEFGGEAYAEKGVITVTIEYRCGGLGFLAHPWLTEADPDGISGNYGIYDQIAALKWVRDNIAAFGGDPDNITVFGQSAGCMSTQVLITSPLTEGMIAKAILQSGAQVRKHFLATPTLAEQEEYGKRIVKITRAKDLPELMALPAETVKAAKGQFDGEQMLKQQSEGNDAGGLVVVPSVDGVLLKEDVGSAIRGGRIKRIPYMVGCTIDDLGTNDADRAAGVPGLILEEAKAFCETQESFGAPDTYCYLFSRDMPDEDGTSVPAFHTAEVWYSFGTLGRCWRPFTEHDFAISREMVDAWTNFMKTGDPNGGACEGWKPYRKENPYVREFR